MQARSNEGQWHRFITPLILVKLPGCQSLRFQSQWSSGVVVGPHL